MNTELKEIFASVCRIGQVLGKCHYYKLLAALVLMVVAGALSSMPPIVLGKVLDFFVDNTAYKPIEFWPFLLILLGILSIRETTQVGRKYLVEDAVTKFEKEIRIKLVEHLLMLDLNFFKNSQVGALQGKLNRSLEGVTKLIKLTFLDFLPSVFIAAFAIVVAIAKSPILGGVMSLVIPIGIFIVLKQIASQKGIRVSLLRGKDTLDGTVVELLGGIENVRALNSEKLEVRRVDKVSENLRSNEIKHHIAMAWYDAGKYMNEGVFHIVVLALAIGLAVNGKISTGDILTYSMLFVGVVTPLREVHRIFDEAHEASIRTRDLFSLWDEKIDISFKESDKKSKQDRFLSATRDSAVGVKGVTLAFPGCLQKVLKNVSLSVGRGQFVGIVGRTGSGKSTLLKAMLGLVHYDDGIISIMGESLSDLSREEIATKSCYVSQDPFIVSGTVYENVVYGSKTSVAKEEVETATKKACIYEDILAMEKGWDTQVGERGCKLAGGQKQRIALARAFLKRPEILFLDEATSALDNNTEKSIQDAIEKELKDCAVIAIAHRVTTLKNADTIYVMEGGELIKECSYDDLVEPKKNNLHPLSFIVPSNPLAKRRFQLA